MIAAVVVALAGAALLWLCDLLQRQLPKPEDTPADAAGVGQPATADRTCAPDGADSPARFAGWLPVTLPALPALSPPRAPRVCAGRVATIERIRALYDAADRPVAAYLAALGWPAPEGISPC